MNQNFENEKSQIEALCEAVLHELEKSNEVSMQWEQGTGREHSACGYQSHHMGGCFTINGVETFRLHREFKYWHVGAIDGMITNPDTRLWFFYPNAPRYCYIWYGDYPSLEEVKRGIINEGFEMDRTKLIAKRVATAAIIEASKELSAGELENLLKDVAKELQKIAEELKKSDKKN